MRKHWHSPLSFNMDEIPQADLLRQLKTEKTPCCFLGNCFDQSNCKNLCGASGSQLIYLSTDQVKVCGLPVQIHIAITLGPEEQEKKELRGKRQIVVHKTKSSVMQFTAAILSNGLLDAVTLGSYRHAIVQAASDVLAVLLSSTRRCAELGHILVELGTILGTESVGVLIEEMKVLPIQLVNVIDQLRTQEEQSDSVFFYFEQDNFCKSLTQIILNGEASVKTLFGRILTSIVMEGQNLGDTSIFSVTTDAVVVNVLGRLKLQIALWIMDDVIKLKTMLIGTKAKKSEVDKTYCCECRSVQKFVQHVIATAFPGHLDYDCQAVVSFCSEFGRTMTPSDDNGFACIREGLHTEWHTSGRSAFAANSRNQSLILPTHEESPYSSLDGIKGLYAQNRSLSSTDNEPLETATVDNTEAAHKNWSLGVSSRSIFKEFTSHSEHKGWLGEQSREPPSTLNNVDPAPANSASQEYIFSSLYELRESASYPGLGTPLNAEKSDSLLEKGWWTKVELGKALYDKDQMCKAEQLAEVKLELEDRKKRRQPHRVCAHSGPGVPTSPSGSANGCKLNGRCIQSSTSCDDNPRRNDYMNSAFSVTDGEEGNSGNEGGAVETNVYQQNGASPLNGDVVQPKSGGGEANAGLAMTSEKQECSGATVSVQDKSTGDIGYGGKDCRLKDYTEMPTVLIKTSEDDPETKDDEHITCSSDGSFSRDKLCHPMAEGSIDSTDGNDQYKYHITESEEFESCGSFGEMEDSAEQGGIDVVDGPASRSTHRNGTGGHLVSTASAAEHAGAEACSTQQRAVNTVVTSGNTNEPPSRGVPCNEDSSQQEWGAINTEPLSKPCGFSLINGDEGTSPTRSDHTTTERTEEDTPAVIQLNPRKEEDFTPPKAHFDPAGEEVVDSPQPSPSRWAEAMHYSSKDVLNDPREASVAKASGNEWDVQGARPKDTQRSLSPPATQYGLDSGFMAKHSSFVALDSTSAGNSPLQPDGNHQTQGCVLGGAPAADQVPRTGETHDRLLGGALATDHVPRTGETHNRLLGGAPAADQVPRAGDSSRFRETAPREVLKEEAISNEVTADEFSSLGPASMMTSMRSLPVMQPSDSLPYHFSSSREPREPWRFARAGAGAPNDPSAETSAKISEMSSRFDRMILEKNERDRVASNLFLKIGERSKREQKDKSENEKQEILDSKVNRESNQPARAPVQESPRWLCEHYQRRCKVRFPCCGKFYPCHRCHNASDECPKEDVKALQATHIQCLVCKAEQEITEYSHTCKDCNTKMSDYFCPKCKHFTGVEKKPYHCEKCGICRIHKDRSFHCSVCNVCLDKRLEGKHKCRADSGHDECCICLEDAFSGCQILPCSHKVHRDCAIAMLQNGIRSCPVCRHPLYKSASNGS